MGRAPYRGSVYRFLLTPRWWGINVFVLLAIPFCIFMGSWQLSRFEGRVHEEHAANRQAASDASQAARPLDSMLPVNKATSGRRVSAHGRYGAQLLVPGRQLDDKNGFYVLTLLRTDQGKSLPVVRGWLPGTASAAKTPAAPRGEVTVVGALQASETPGDNGVSAQGGLPAGQTAAISSAALVNLVPDRLYDAWVTLDKADAGMKACRRRRRTVRAGSEGVPEPRVHRGVVRLRRVHGVHVVPAAAAGGRGGTGRCAGLGAGGDRAGFGTEQLSRVGAAPSGTTARSK